MEIKRKVSVYFKACSKEGIYLELKPLWQVCTVKKGTCACLL